ncbi:MAG: PQQ-dependent sugar dehydrogenase [Alphaproteobacteria bacterium]
MRASRRRAFGAGLAAVACGFPAFGARASGPRLRAVPVATGLENPWSIAFLPDGRMLASERPGRLRIVGRDGRMAEVAGVPPVWAMGQGGLLDICLHPRFATNDTIYLSYAAPVAGGATIRIARARLAPGPSLVDLQPILDAGPPVANGFHFGCRLAFAPDGMLLATTGDRLVAQARAGDPADLRGKTIRLRDDGGIPGDNPFVGRAGARPEIFTMGHRNPQGLAIHPGSGEPWSHEHGPRGGDEVNLLRPGADHGWPRTTHGVDYSGATISPHRSLPGIADPLWVWTPSIAPSGMAFCTSPRYPGWQGSLFVGALAGQALVRLEHDGDRVLREERLLRQEGHRIRDVRQGPDGWLYLAVDAMDAAILRLELA